MFSVLAARNGSIRAVRHVGKQHHVRLVDRLEAADGRAVEGQAVLEDVLVERLRRDREVLLDAGQVAEADVDVLDVFVRDVLDDLFGRGERHACAPSVGCAPVVLRAPASSQTVWTLVLPVIKPMFRGVTRSHCPRCQGRNVVDVTAGAWDRGDPQRPAYPGRHGTYDRHLAFRTFRGAPEGTAGRSRRTAANCSVFPQHGPGSLVSTGRRVAGTVARLVHCRWRSRRCLVGENPLESSRLSAHTR